MGEGAGEQRSVMYLPGGGVVGVGPPQLHQYISKTHVRACEKYTKKSSDPHSSFFYKYITGRDATADGTTTSSSIAAGMIAATQPLLQNISWR